MVMGWFSDNDWFVWTVAAVLLAVGEIFSIDMVMGMLAIAALVAMVVALVGGGWVLQFIAFAVVAVGLLAFVRPPIVRRLHAGPDVLSGTAGLPGKPGYVEQDISSTGGLVRIGGEVWTAQAFEEGSVIPAGTRVEVVEIRGATAVVRLARLES
jgi:membrane protein implicated in regulation of membrane protease activity